MKINKKIKDITSIAIVASLYIGLTLLTYPISYGSSQFRIAEMLVLLSFFNRKHGYGVTIGVFIANLFNPTFALIDAFIGTLSTFIAVLLINKSKNLFVASLFPVLTSVLVVAEIAIFTDVIWYIVALEVIGTMLIIECVIGYTLFKILSSNKSFLKIIDSNKEGYLYEI